MHAQERVHDDGEGSTIYMSKQYDTNVSNTGAAYRLGASCDKEMQGKNVPTQHIRFLLPPFLLFLVKRYRNCFGGGFFRVLRFHPSKKCAYRCLCMYVVCMAIMYEGAFDIYHKKVYARTPGYKCIYVRCCKPRW